MSRIGKKPIAVPTNVTVSVDRNNAVTVKGPKGSLIQPVDQDIKISVEDAQVTVNRPTDQKRHKALHGLYRSLINNMVIGVSDGYKIDLEIVGVGYKATSTGNVLELSLGYSNPIFFVVPKEVSINAVMEKGKSPVVSLQSIDKQLVGQIAAKIRSLRKVEPYKGKGVRFLGQKLGVELRKKAGKTASKK